MEGAFRQRLVVLSGRRRRCHAVSGAVSRHFARADDVLDDIARLRAFPCATLPRAQRHLQYNTYVKLLLFFFFGDDMHLKTTWCAK